MKLKSEIDIKIINCLYSHFKNASKRLRIVCDWDEVIQVLEPKVYYELSQEEAHSNAPWWMPNGTKFEDFFSNFWLNPPIYYSDYGSHSAYAGKNIVKNCTSSNNISFASGLRSIKNEADKIKNKPDFYQCSPFLTLAKELLKLVKENKAEVSFLSAYDQQVFANGDPRKKKIFAETFGKIPDCSLNLVGFSSEKTGKTKSEWIRENIPNCDVVIDDNPHILAGVLKNNKNIIAVAPYYPGIKHHEKVLLVKTSVSDLKKNSFI
jgi:hypothetical protein